MRMTRWISLRPKADEVSSTVHIGELAPMHRERVAEILVASQVFRLDEVEVALELFDEGCGTREAGGETAATIPPPASHLPLPDYLFLGAFTPEEELVGYACYGVTPGTDRTFDLYWIAVDPESQGAGIGTLLLKEVERRLEGHHARMLVVETSSRSDYGPTRVFYERCGYNQAARVREFYAPSDDRITFTKRFHLPQGQGA